MYWYCYCDFMTKQCCFVCCFRSWCWRVPWCCWRPGIASIGIGIGIGIALDLLWWHTSTSTGRECLLLCWNSTWVCWNSKLSLTTDHYHSSAIVLPSTVWPNSTRRVPQSSNEVGQTLFCWRQYDKLAASQPSFVGVGAATSTLVCANRLAVCNLNAPPDVPPSFLPSLPYSTSMEDECVLGYSILDQQTHGSDIQNKTKTKQKKTKKNLK